MLVDRPWCVLKFGGTSVGAPDRLRRVVDIVAQTAREHRVAVVVSAVSGVTDQLVAALDDLDAGTFDPDAFLTRLRGRHRTLAAEVLNEAFLVQYRERLDEQLARLRQALEQDPCTPATRDEVLAAGERLAVPLIALALREVGLEAVPTDASTLIRTDDGHGNARVDVHQTRRQVLRLFEALAGDVIPVVTGFIGSTAAGATTTLGRGGSDYSAALLAGALRADRLERWTDVDGLYTDDPNENAHAQRLAYVVLEEAWAWNHAGRLGMHQKALDPLVEQGIPVHVRSTATPDRPGTWIIPAGRKELLSAVAS